MFEVFKWVKGINKENIYQVLEFSSQDRTRGNSFKRRLDESMDRDDRWETRNCLV